MEKCEENPLDDLNFDDDDERKEFTINNIKIKFQELQIEVMRQRILEKQAIIYRLANNINISGKSVEEYMKDYAAAQKRSNIVDSKCSVDEYISKSN